MASRSRRAKPVKQAAEGAPEANAASDTKVSTAAVAKQKPAAKAAVSPVATPASAPEKPSAQPVLESPAAKRPAATPVVPVRAINQAIPRAIVRFGRDWAVQVEGALAASGKLTIEYDPARAQDLGAVAWSVQAFALFAPGGEIIEAAAIEPSSSPSKPARTRPVSVEIPPRSHEVQIWFRIRTDPGQPGECWDSNFGHNYRFQVSH